MKASFVRQSPVWRSQLAYENDQGNQARKDDSEPAAKSEMGTVCPRTLLMIQGSKEDQANKLLL